MTVKLKPIAEQVIFLTGASSGIGRATALLLGERGAKVVLFARREDALEDVAAAIQHTGGQALIVPGDVSDFEQMQRAAEATIRHFGRIDTWINNAGISEYALIEDQSLSELRRIVDVNLMGVIHGVKVALPHLKNNGGAIINVGSVLSDRAIPLQGIYCATKHGVKGSACTRRYQRVFPLYCATKHGVKAFTDSLRMELKHAQIPISVTLIKPAPIDTPFYTTARSRMGVRPKPIEPIYDARVVAEAIVFACEHPRRDIYAGGFGKVLDLMERFSPALADWYMVQNGRMFQDQKDETQPDDGRSNLFLPPTQEASISGGYNEKSVRVSPYTRTVELHPNATKLAAAALAIGLASFFYVKAQGAGRNGL